MTTAFCIATNPTNIPEVQCVIVPFHGKKLEVYGMANWLTSYGRYFVKLGKTIEKNDLIHNEQANKEPILVKAEQNWETHIDLIFINDDVKRPAGEVIFQPLNFAKRKGYTNVAMQLYRSGKESYPQAQNQKINALTMWEMHNFFPEMNITIALNALEPYAIEALHTRHVTFLGYWHEDIQKFQPT